MVYLPRLGALLAVASFSISHVQAHPGEEHTHEQIKREIELRDHYATIHSRSLSQCSGSAAHQAMKKRSIARRAATADRLRAARGIATEKKFLHRRDTPTFASFSSLSHNLTGSISSQDPSDLFTSNTTCILSPELTIGPYYVSGELIRSDIGEGEAGVPLHLEVELVDITTCAPVANDMVDIWGTNATGVYSGVSASGGLNTTFGRGVQESNSEGVVEFDLIMPGHYTGRATHIHIASHTGSTKLANGTYTGGEVSHVGQLFFDEDLRAAVEATEPYSRNLQEIMSNADDWIAQESANGGYDPYVEYVFLGDEVSDGLLAWISIGVNTTANYTADARAASYWAADGGHESPNAMRLPCGVSFPGGNGTGLPPLPPKGAPPPREGGACNTTALPSGTLAVLGTAIPGATASPSAGSEALLGKRGIAGRL